MEYRSITLSLKYPDGQPVLLDSNKIFWKKENRFLEQYAIWDLATGYGSYVIVDDGMLKELENKKEIMRFTGYLNGEIVCERDVLVGADQCHVDYFGKEPLTQIIYGIPEEVRDRKFCELVNVENIRAIIPSFNAFCKTIDENLPFENKLQLIVDWLLSHSCITNVRVNGVYSTSEIAFSFVENGEVVNKVMLVGKDLIFRGFRD